MCRKRRFVTLRRFRCPVCGQEMVASKLHSPTFKGHIKTMYCPMCKEDRDFVQTEMDRTR